MTTALGFGDRFLVFFAVEVVLYLLLPSWIAVTFAIATTALGVAYLWYDSTYWERHGVPAVKANIFLGSTMKFLKNGHLNDLENFKRFDRTYGDIIFGRKNISSMDFDLIRSVMVKEFSHFENRLGSKDPDPKLDQRNVMRNMLTMKKGEDWKRVRNVITPAFTTGKMRKLVPLLEQSANELRWVIEKFIDEGKEIPIKDTMGRVSLDMIARCGFAVNINAFDDKNESPFIKHAKEMFTSRKWTFLLFFGFPYLMDKLQGVLGKDLLFSSTVDFFQTMLERMYEQRKSDPDAREKYNDLFQLLLNSMDETQSNGAEILPEDKEIFHDELQKLKNKHITKMELIAQSFILLVAGYETTGNTIHFVLYNLAKLPEIQKRVQEELDRVVGDSEHITYDHIVNLHYLNQVIYETLRMYPPAIQTNRECNEPVTLQGIPFEVGTLMTVPVFAIHYNPEYYPEPEKFDPDRFSPEEKANRDPLTFLPFGHGPRNCVGMRLAEFEIRTTLAVLLRHYNFRAGKTSPDLPLEVESTSGLLKPKQTLYAIAERRSKLRD